MYELIIEENAVVEIEEIYYWYEDRSPGLGERFKNDFEKIITTLSHFPNSFAFITLTYRRAPLKYFPYFIIYDVIQHTVVILSVVYAGRNLDELQSKW